MNSVEYLVGGEELINTPLRAYDDEACAFIAELSSVLMRSPALRAYPDIAALAFWCRRSNIQSKKQAFGESFRLGRGLCFHIAPGNIPVNFAFSYLFSLLAGNANIVRIPSKPFKQIALICDAINDTLVKYPQIQKRTAFIRYPANNEITAEYCKIADARLIWGGDATILAIKALQAKPRCVDISFADRYSVCILGARAIERATDAEIAQLADNFYNDTYLMDQNACSSPQLILWAEDSVKGRERFWNAVFDLAKRKYALQAAVAVDKYTHMCEDAVELDILGGISYRENLLYRAELTSLRPGMENIRGKCGYFYEYSLKDADSFWDVVTDKYQTLTYYGVEPSDLRNSVIDKRLRGIDRIAPVGKAMDIDVIWDGYDLVRSLSRVVNLEG